MSVFGRVLLTGVNGQVGGELHPLLQPMAELWTPTRQELNLSDLDAIRSAVRRFRPRWIVNPAAYTAVDKAESEPELAFLLNRDAVRVFGDEAAAIGAGVIHFSTDYVFAGEGERPWREDDQTGPLGVYGASKLAGEQALAETGAQHIIFRTSWVYGATGKNFLKSILRFAREKEEMRIVADQHGAPTWSRDLANLTLHTMTRIEGRSAGGELESGFEAFGGIYHACDDGFTTWFGFAEDFLRLAREHEPETSFARLSPIATADYPTPAKRPANSRMDMTRLRERLLYNMPGWQDSVAQVMQEVQRTAVKG